MIGGWWMRRQWGLSCNPLGPVRSPWRGFSVNEQSVLWIAAQGDSAFLLPTVGINTRAQFSGVLISKDNNNFLKKERSQTSYSEANFRATARLRKEAPSSWGAVLRKPNLPSTHPHKPAVWTEGSRAFFSNPGISAQPFYWVSETSAMETHLFLSTVQQGLCQQCVPKGSIFRHL